MMRLTAPRSTAPRSAAPRSADCAASGAATAANAAAARKKWRMKPPRTKAYCLARALGCADVPCNPGRDMDGGVDMDGTGRHWTALASAVPGTGRSEEHTSELQSLMRSSYAVFCLKKKRIA